MDGGGIKKWQEKGDPRKKTYVYSVCPQQSPLGMSRDRAEPEGLLSMDTER